MQKWLDIATGIFTIATGIFTIIGSIATIISTVMIIWLYISKKKSIKSIFNLLVNYSYQLTLTELKEKLERINDYNANNDDDKEKIKEILADIVGQIKGNNKLKNHFNDILEDMSNFGKGRKNPNWEIPKRELVGELRERIRSLNVKKELDNFGEQP